MKKIIDIIKGHIKSNRNKILLYGIAAMVLVISVIYLISSMDGQDDDRDLGTISNKSDSNSTIDSPSEELIEATKMPESNNLNEIDASDPQSQGATGLELNIKDLDLTGKKEDIMVYGIDVAKWQSVIDWKLVKDAGIEFAMIRIGYRTLDKGIIVEDPYAKYNLQQATKHDIPIGVYFFSTAINEKEAKEEADWVADFIGPYPITYPVAYNCEGFTDPNNRQYGMTKEARSDVAIAFLDHINNSGYTPMFYAAKNEMEQNSQWNTDILSQRYKIWVAQYPDNIKDNMKSSYTGKYDMWQYTSKGQVPGIEQAVDLDIAYFSYKEIAKPKDPRTEEEVTADPIALIQFKEVKETVTAKIETNLRSYPSTENPDTVVYVLKNGDTAQRTGIADNGWSRVEYQGQTLYAVSNYLTTDLEYRPPTPTPIIIGPTFDEVNEEVTAKEKTNLRSEPSTENDDTIKAVLYYGEIALRTGIGNNGWSRVEYNGQILYALTRYLTTDLNYQENKKPTIDNPEAGITFTAVNEKVTAKEVTNLRLVPTTEIEDTVVAVLNHGDIAIRTGIGDNGWSRLEYDGKTLYAVTNYLEEVK